MSINFTSVYVKHERRVRLVFDAQLSLDAFKLTSYYSAANDDGGAASPSIVKALIVSNSPNVVELQLDTDLVQGARYSFTASAVPAADLSTCPTATHYATIGTEPARAAVGATGPVTDLERELFGVDVLFTGDWVEAPDGDLATVAGLRSATLDLEEAMVSNGLPWDPSYGLRAREEVDGAPQAITKLRGRAIEIMRGDDRIIAADAEADLTDTSQPVLIVKPTWIGARGTPQQPPRIPFVTDR